MIRKFLGSRVRQVASGVALCTVAIAAQADPISLQGVCHLTSIIASQGKCQLTYYLEDNSLTGSTGAKSSTIKVDGIIVARYLNDSVNPFTLYSLANVSGTTEVPCGTSHVVTAFITRLGVGTVSEKVGSLPAVLCPTAP